MGQVVSKGRGWVKKVLWGGITAGKALRGADKAGERLQGGGGGYGGTKPGLQLQP